MRSAALAFGCVLALAATACGDDEDGAGGGGSGPTGAGGGEGASCSALSCGDEGEARVANAAQLVETLAVAVDDQATAVEAACLDLADSVGAPSGPVDGETPDERIVRVCREAVDALRTAYAGVQIEYSPGVCGADLEVLAACEGGCACDACPGRSDACRDAAFGDCGGACSGTCSPQDGAPVACEGTCYGACDGACDGTTSPEGVCSGECTGACAGSCSYAPDSEVACAGDCAASCSVELTSAACADTRPAEGPCAECSSGCVILAEARPRCTDMTTIGSGLPRAVGDALGTYARECLGLGQQAEAVTGLTALVTELVDAAQGAAAVQCVGDIADGTSGMAERLSAAATACASVP